MSDKRAKLLEEIAAVEQLIADVIDGKVRYCETCAQPFVYHGLGSGFHPGVFCPNACNDILLEMGPAGDK